MDAPVCRTCGKKHWSRVCDDVTKPVTKNVTPRDTVSVTPQKEIEALRAELDYVRVLNEGLGKEVDRLTTEVARLKKMLADEHQKTVPVRERNRIALTPAERKRNQRAKAKQASC
jgi:hypothetical protein